MSHSCQWRSTACHCHICDINVTSLSQLRITRLSLSLVCHVFSVTSLSLSLVCHTFFVTRASLSLACHTFFVTRVSLSLPCHIFSNQGVSLSHITPVTWLSLVCHCPCGEYYLSVPDWYFSRIGRIQRRPPVSKLISAILIKIKWLARKVTKMFEKFT